MTLLFSHTAIIVYDPYNTIKQRAEYVANMNQLLKQFLFTVYMHTVCACATHQYVVPSHLI